MFIQLGNLLKFPLRCVCVRAHVLTIQMSMAERRMSSLNSVLIIAIIINCPSSHPRGTGHGEKVGRTKTGC